MSRINIVHDCSFAARHRLTNKLWQYHGLAGIGEYFIDLIQNQVSVEHLLPGWIAEGILPLQYKMKRGEVAFPGESLLKICGDYAMGTAGIGMFMNRMQENSKRFLFLDDVLD